MSTNAENQGDTLPLPTGPRPDPDHLAWILSGMPKVGRLSIDIHVFDSLRAEVNANAAELAKLRGHVEHQRRCTAEEIGEDVERWRKTNDPSDSLLAVFLELKSARARLAEAERSLAQEKYEHAATIDQRDRQHARSAALTAALERLGSSETFTVALALGNDAVSDELRARVTYARDQLAALSQEK